MRPTLFFTDKISSTTSRSSSVRLRSLSCVLDELLVFGYMEFHVAFDHYSSKNTTFDCTNEKNCKKNSRCWFYQRMDCPYHFWIAVRGSIYYYLKNLSTIFFFYGVWMILLMTLLEKHMILFFQIIHYVVVCHML